MSVTLLRTETIFSLEFAMDDRADVWAAIQELYGQPKVTPRVISATVRIDGEGFFYQDEWDDPCLISSSTRGKEMLKRLAERLVENPKVGLQALRDTLSASL